MTRRSIFFWLLILFARNLNAQSVDELQQKLLHARVDTSRINLELALARYYLYLPLELPADLDSSGKHIRIAEQLIKDLNAGSHQKRLWILQAGWALESGDLQAAEPAFSRIAAHYLRLGQYQRAADTWTRLASSIPTPDNSGYHHKIRILEKAYRIYKIQHFDLQAATQLHEISIAYLMSNQFERAEKGFLSVIDTYKKHRVYRIYEVYDRLADAYAKNGKAQKEMMNRILAVVNYDADPKKDPVAGLDQYFALGVAYYNDRQYARALEYHIKTVNLANRLDNQFYYEYALHEVIVCLTNLSRYDQAIKYIRRSSLRYPEKTAFQQSLLISAELKLYNKFGKTRAAEQLTSRFKKVMDLAVSDLDTQLRINPAAADNFVSLYDPLFKHYLKTRQWEESAAALEKTKSMPKGSLSVLTRKTIYENQYKLDSARGNMQDALRAFQSLKMVQDSLANAANRKQVNEMEAKYKLVTKNKQIQQLHNNAALQKSNLEKINLQKNVTLGGILIAIVFAVMMYLAFRSKKRSNLRLQLQQDEINAKNDRLTQVLSEKEWLLKEVHHRVKNNLQIIMSLLYSQAAYLKNAVAKAAIKDAENRVQAISIIHQKLYNGEDMVSVEMADYVRDLVGFLSSSYRSTRRKISIQQTIEPISLDISQAVPIGLILNEVITNSIKYAFDDQGGEITIQGELSADQLVKLTVSDNGKGLPEDFNVAATSSLGIEMMKALSKQLNGSFKIYNDQGVTINLTFPLERVGIK